MPIKAAVISGQSLALSATAGDGSGAVLAVGVALLGGSDPRRSTPLGITWDGARLVLSAPAGYRILDTTEAPLAEQGCSPNDAVPMSVTCQAPGGTPRLFDVAIENLQRPLPTLRPPAVGAQVIAPGEGVAYSVGRPVTFVAAGVMGVAVVFIWDFGDGTSADGQVVQHDYAEPGSYTAQLNVIADSVGIPALSVMAATITIVVDPPAQPNE